MALESTNSLLQQALANTTESFRGTLDTAIRQAEGYRAAKMQIREQEFKLRAERDLLLFQDSLLTKRQDREFEQSKELLDKRFGNDVVLEEYRHANNLAQDHHRFVHQQQINEAEARARAGATGQIDLKDRSALVGRQQDAIIAAQDHLQKTLGPLAKMGGIEMPEVFASNDISDPNAYVMVERNGSKVRMKAVEYASMARAQNAENYALATQWEAVSSDPAKMATLPRQYREEFQKATEAMRDPANRTAGFSALVKLGPPRAMTDFERESEKAFEVLEYSVAEGTLYDIEFGSDEIYKIDTNKSVEENLRSINALDTFASPELKFGTRTMTSTEYATNVDVALMSFAKMNNIPGDINTLRKNYTFNKNRQGLTDLFVPVSGGVSSPPRKDKKELEVAGK